MTMASVNLASGWSQVWGAVSSAIGSSGTNLLTAIGVIIAIGSVVSFLWERKKGGQGNHHKVLYGLLFGALLAGPVVVIPILLTIADFAINIVLGIGQL